MADLINILTAARAQSVPAGPAIKIVRLDANDTTIIPFTTDGVSVYLHYCDLADIGPGYLPCNLVAEGRCLLCDVGRNREQRYLLPVYLPVECAVCVLPISTSQRPNSLLPQLLNHLERKEPVILFLRRDGTKYSVGATPLPADCDNGSEVIAAFRERLESKAVRLEDAFPPVPNARLGKVPEIVQSLALRGKAP